MSRKLKSPKALFPYVSARINVAAHELYTSWRLGVSRTPRGTLNRRVLSRYFWAVKPTWPRDREWNFYPWQCMSERWRKLPREKRVYSFTFQNLFGLNPEHDFLIFFISFFILSLSVLMHLHVSFSRNDIAAMPTFRHSCLLANLMRRTRLKNDPKTSLKEKRTGNIRKKIRESSKWEDLSAISYFHANLNVAPLCLLISKKVSRSYSFFLRFLLAPPFF